MTNKDRVVDELLTTLSMITANSDYEAESCRVLSTLCREENISFLACVKVLAKWGEWNEEYVKQAKSLL